MRRLIISLTVLVAGLFARKTDAQLSDPDEQPSTGRWNAVTPTWGGKQIWADELFFHEWHIQRNTVTYHYRLLDGRNRRHAWGRLDQCQARLDEIKREQNLPPMSGKAVVVLHGLFASPGNMKHMARFLSEQGYVVFNVTYPTTRAPISEHAESLGKVIASLEGIEEINFVAHSMGNLVLRHYLADHTCATTGQQPDRRIKRIVMLGPPNNGAQLAEAFGSLDVFPKVVGPAGPQLGREWQELAPHLATPACEFGVIAGGRNKEKGYNPWLSGDNDLVVSVETTRLPGATDFAVLPVLHRLMMNDEQVQKYTLRFLQSGYFVSPEARRPVVANTSSDATQR